MSTPAGDPPTSVDTANEELTAEIDTPVTVDSTSAAAASTDADEPAALVAPARRRRRTAGQWIALLAVLLIVAAIVMLVFSVIGHDYSDSLAPPVPTASR